MRFHIEFMLIFNAINPVLKGLMISRIFHSWSFHTKFMKLAEDRHPRLAVAGVNVIFSYFLQISFLSGSKRKRPCKNVEFDMKDI